MKCFHYCIDSLNIKTLPKNYDISCSLEKMLKISGKFEIIFISTKWKYLINVEYTITLRIIHRFIYFKAYFPISI